MLSVLHSLLTSSDALWLPPRWGPNRATVTAPQMRVLALPLVPESIHRRDSSNRTSCSSLYERNPESLTRCGIITHPAERQRLAAKKHKSRKKREDTKPEGNRLRAFLLCLLCF